MVVVYLIVTFILRFRIRHLICIGTLRKAAIVIFCFKIFYGIYLLQTAHTPYNKFCFNISDRPMAMRVLPHLYILLSPGIMDILSKFDGDETYAKLDIPEVQDNIPNDLRRSACSKSKSKATNKVIKQCVYKKTLYSSFSICVREDHFLQQLCINGVSRGTIIIKHFSYNCRFVYRTITLHLLLFKNTYIMTLCNY